MSILAGQRVVVIGGSGDIGSIVVQALEGDGVDVFAPARLECDVKDAGSVAGYFDTLMSDGAPLWGLVTCHGAPGCVRPTAELTDDVFKAVLEIDLVGTLRVCQAAYKYMKGGGGGKIVNVSSIHAIATYPERAAYASAKAGVVGLSRALAVEWAKDGISVNCVLPGQVQSTRRTDRISSKRMLERSPSGLLPWRTSVAEAVMYLLSCSGVNGHSLVVDDGWTASAWFDSHV